MSSTTENGPELSLCVDGLPTVMPCFAIVLYTQELLSGHATAVLDAYERFEQLCPRELLHHYGTETMSQRKPVTPRTFDLLKTWLKPGASRREYIALDITGGQSWAAISDINFSVFSREPDAVTYESGKANWIRLTVPLARMRGQLDELEAQAHRVFSSLPFVSGHAGPTLELSPYYRPKSQRFAWKTVMRYRGFDFCDPFADSAAVGDDGLRTVSWLTFLGEGLAKELGGARTLAGKVGAEAEVQALPTGLCLKAGPRPALGDRYANERLTSYEAVFRACENAIVRMNERYSPMMLLEDREENTSRLMRRLAYEDE
jgi:hypothetical protein